MVLVRAGEITPLELVRRPVAIIVAAGMSAALAAAGQIPVDRVIVVDQGKIVADGPRERIMQALSAGRISRAS